MGRRLDYSLSNGDGTVDKGSTTTSSLYNGDGLKFTVYTDTGKIPCKVLNDENIVRHGQTGEALGTFQQGRFGKRNKAVLTEVNNR